MTRGLACRWRDFLDTAVPIAVSMPLRLGMPGADDWRDCRSLGFGQAFGMPDCALAFSLVDCDSQQRLPPLIVLSAMMRLMTGHSYLSSLSS